MQYLCIGHAWIWNASISHQFGQQNAEAPHIGLDGKLGIVGSLRGCPFDREAGSHPSLILIFLNETGKPEVCYLDYVILSAQDISSRQVSVNIVLRLQ